MQRSLSIAVNTRWVLSQGLDGTGWYTKSLLDRLIVAHPEVTWHLLFDRTPPTDWQDAPNVKRHVLSPPARHWSLWWIWNEWSVPKLLEREKVDLYWSPDGMLPNALPCVGVASIHDLNFIHHPEWLPWTVARYYRWTYRKSARLANHILTVSEASKNDLLATYGLSADRVTFAYNAPQTHFTPLSAEAQRDARVRWTGGKPYFLFVGAFTARKNVSTLVSGFDAFKKRTGLPHQLILVGDFLHAEPALDKALKAMQHRSSVVFPGRAKSADLNELYGAATAFCYPSLFEGFGIPLVEAMAAGCPVVSSHASCLPEIASDAALFCDPLDVNAWDQSLSLVAQESTAARNERIQAGIDRASSFSWESTAETVWSVMHTLLHPW